MLRGSEQAQSEEGTKIYDLVIGDRVAKEAVTEFTGDGKHKELAGLFKLKFASADAWFEEDERIYVHPKDPYKVCCLATRCVSFRAYFDSVRSASTYFSLPGMSVSK